MGLLSRVRGLLAGALALLALGTAVQALRTYAAHQLTAGVLATGALAVTLIVGLASLGGARRRIARELVGLRGAGGELLNARRQRLQTIAAAGIRPDRAVLAEATAADEAGRAYFGRYLVATTVLLGLVGTFAGLMETLGRISPLLGDRDSGALALLAGPLAGLHVTFGASLVAILATLALALAQGDLTLHEDLALALLEDRTTHELIPKLWPPAEDAAERTVRAVDALKATLADALARALEKSGQRIAESARAESERAARALETAATTIDARLGASAATVAGQLAASAGAVEKQLTATATALEKQLGATAVAIETQIARLCDVVGASAHESAKRQSAALVEAAATAGRQVRAAVEETAARAAAVVEASAVRSAAASEAAAARATNAAESAVRATTEALTTTLSPLFATEANQLDGVRAALVEVASRIEETATRLAAVDRDLGGLSRDHAAAIDRAGKDVLAAFERAVLGAGAALDGAAVQLAGAARELGTGVAVWQPTISALTGELGSLGREVALLAAPAPDDELGAVVLGELERLGDGVDRLTALLRASAPAIEEPPAVEPEPLAPADEPAPSPADEAPP